MYKLNQLPTKYIIAGLVGILLILILYMAFSNPNQGTIEGFSFVDKPKPTKLGERKRENFLAGEIKGFAFNTPVKERMTNSPLAKLKSNSNRNNTNTRNRNKSRNNMKNNSKNIKEKSKLNKLAKRGHVDEFQDVLNEVDSMDVSSISVKGISDTVRRYNDNIENRLKYAKQKNNSSDMEAAMSQFDVLKDEFVKIFAFSDYL